MVAFDFKLIGTGFIVGCHQKLAAAAVIGVDLLLELDLGQFKQIIHEHKDEQKLHDENDLGRLGGLRVADQIRHGLERGADVAEDEL